MPKKPAPAPKPEKPQRERFIEFAREHGADDPDALDRAVGEIARAESEKKKRDES